MEEKKDSKVGYVISLIILILMLLSLGGFVIYDKLIKKSSKEECICDKCEDKECPKCDDKEKSTCPDTITIKDHLVDTRIGIIHIVNNGDVYLEPTNKLRTAAINEEDYDIKDELIKTFGSPKKYTLTSEDIYMEGKTEIEGYKLSLNNIRSVSEFTFGNGGDDDSIIFISTSGKISELYIGSYEPGVMFKKDIKGYDNIVAMEEAGSEEGWAAIAYDKCNVGHSYTGIKYSD